jgi:hypothetical protein
MAFQNSEGPLRDAPIARLMPFRKSRRGITRFIPNSRSRFSLLTELSETLSIGIDRATKCLAQLSNAFGFPQNTTGLAALFDG